MEKTDPIDRPASTGTDKRYDEGESPLGPQWLKPARSGHFDATEVGRLATVGASRATVEASRATVEASHIAHRMQIQNRIWHIGTMTY